MGLKEEVKGDSFSETIDNINTTSTLWKQLKEEVKGDNFSETIDNINTTSTLYVTPQLILNGSNLSDPDLIQLPVDTNRPHIKSRLYSIPPLIDYSLKIIDNASHNLQTIETNLTRHGKVRPAWRREVMHDLLSGVWPLKTSLQGNNSKANTKNYISEKVKQQQKQQQQIQKQQQKQQQQKQRKQKQQKQKQQKQKKQQIQKQQKQQQQQK